MRHNHLVRSANGSNGSGIGLSLAIRALPVNAPAPANTTRCSRQRARVTCIHVQNTLTMPRRRLFRSLGAKRCPSSGRAREEEDDEEDEGNVTDDEGDDDEEDDGGYSVRVCRLCQW
jgi:hypothetical protein